MKAFWKIPKEWVQDWGLSWSEAGVLSDMVSYPDATREERATRVGMTKPGLIKVLKRLQESKQSLLLLGKQSLLCDGKQSLPSGVNKVYQKRLTKFTKNGKQSLPPPTPPYIEDQEKNIEDITLDKSNVPNADASAGKKTSQKKEKKEEPKVYTIQHRCRTFFETIYEQKKGDKYYYAAKDAAALKQLLNKIKFLMPEEQKKDDAKLEENFQIFINTIFHSKILGAWITDNLSLPIINDKFNEIYSQLKNGKSSSNAADNFHVFGSRNITPDILAEFT